MITGAKTGVFKNIYTHFINILYIWAMKQLHPKQKKIHDLMKKNIDNPITLAELSREVGIESPSVLYHHLGQLVKKGLIKRSSNNLRDYIVLDAPESSVVYINKYGTAQCGSDGKSLEETPIERIPIASSLLRFQASDAFIVEAKGDSMTPKIENGDIIISKRQNYAENGDIIVCVHNERVLIKQYMLIGQRQVLHSLNEKHKLIEVRNADDLNIAGIVKNIIRHN